MGWIRDLWENNCRDMGLKLSTLKSFRDIRVYMAKNQIINGKSTCTLSAPVYFVWNGNICTLSTENYQTADLAYECEVKKEGT